MPVKINLQTYQIFETHGCSRTLKSVEVDAPITNVLVPHHRLFDQATLYSIYFISSTHKRGKHLIDFGVLSRVVLPKAVYHL